MTVLSPPPQDELELLIREARARQRRRRLIATAAVAVVAAAGLSLWAAIPGRGNGAGGPAGGRSAGATHGIDNAGRVQIAEVGTSGGVTWALNGLDMWVTTNGGRTWRTSVPPAVQRIGDLMMRIPQVTFLDREHGWLLTVGVPEQSRTGAFYRTDDGGRTWHRSIPAGCCGPFSFASRRLGFFLGPSKLVSTMDGGGRWRPVGGTRFRNGVPTFVDARHGVAVGTGNGRLYSTGDGGRQWLSVPVPASEGVFANAAAFGQRLVVPGISSTASAPWRLIVYVSGDGGTTWAVRRTPKRWMLRVRSVDPQEFSAASPSVWYAVGRQNLAVTMDAGRSWRLVRVADLPPRWTIQAIDFTSASVGWAIFNGPNQSFLMRTTDGGRRWRPAGPRGPKPPPLRRKTACGSSCRRP